VLCKSDHSATSFFFFFLSTTAACFRCCCCCCCWPFSLLSFSLSSFSFSLRRRGFDSTTCPQIHNSSIHTTRSIILPRLATTSAPTKIKKNKKNSIPSVPRLTTPAHAHEQSSRQFRSPLHSWGHPIPPHHLISKSEACDDPRYPNTHSRPLFSFHLPTSYDRIRFRPQIQSCTTPVNSDSALGPPRLPPPNSLSA
jgi:hypothetical protein